MRTLLLSAALLAAAGCGSRPNTSPVTGKVTLNGKGVTAGTIWFHPADGNPYKGEKPSCLLQADGGFTMRTYPWGDGVPPGPYRVTLAPDLAGRLGKPQYGDPAKSPWTIDVPDAGVKDKEFEVK